MGSNLGVWESSLTMGGGGRGARWGRRGGPGDSRGGTNGLGIRPGLQHNQHLVADSPEAHHDGYDHEEEEKPHPKGGVCETAGDFPVTLIGRILNSGKEHDYRWKLRKISASTPPLLNAEGPRGRTRPHLEIKAQIIVNCRISM